MYRSAALSLAVSLLGTHVQAAPSSHKIILTEEETATKVRNFLEAFASSPVASEALVSSDAVLIEGDVGGQFSFYASEVQRSAKRLASCKVVSLRREAVSSFGLTFRGAYSCDGPNGTKISVPLSVTLVNGQISKLWISWLE